jgi:hypothetical protein
LATQNQIKTLPRINTDLRGFALASAFAATIFIRDTIHSRQPSGWLNLPVVHRSPGSTSQRQKYFQHSNFFHIQRLSIFTRYSIRQLCRRIKSSDAFLKAKSTEDIMSSHQEKGENS